MIRPYLAGVIVYRTGNKATHAGWCGPTQQVRDMVHNAVNDKANSPVFVAYAFAADDEEAKTALEQLSQWGAFVLNNVCASATETEQVDLARLTDDGNPHENDPIPEPPGGVIVLKSDAEQNVRGEPIKWENLPRELQESIFNANPTETAGTIVQHAERHYAVFPRAALARPDGQ